MQKVIRLSDLAHIPTPTNDKYSPVLMQSAREALELTGLRFNNCNGRMYDNLLGEIERFVRQSDHKPHADLESVMRWEFSRRIGNSASRLSRGLPV